MRCVLHLLITSCLLAMGCSAMIQEPEATAAVADASAEAPADPFLWLENIEGAKALTWVKERNDETLGEFEADERYSGFLTKAETILNATDRIPYGSVRAEWFIISGRTKRIFAVFGDEPL